MAHGRLEEFPGDYETYRKLKPERDRLRAKEAEQQRKMIERTEDFIRRNIAGQKTKQAQDRQKKLARLERIEKMSEIVGPVMGFDEVTRSGDVVIESARASRPRTSASETAGRSSEAPPEPGAALETETDFRLASSQLPRAPAGMLPISPGSRALACWTTVLLAGTDVS